MNKYLKQYTLSNVFSMMRNNLRKPKECTDDFQGRLVVISGATSGIGYRTARKYAAHGANVLTINRNEERSKAMCKDIHKEFGVECTYKIADYSRLSDVRKVGQEIRDSNMEIDVLIHNAGAFYTGKQFSEDNNELGFQVAHLDSFMLNYMLKDMLKARGKARIIMVNSEGHRFCVAGVRLDDLKYEKRRYTGFGSYGVAKTAQLLSMIKFADYFEGSGVTINAMHPGDVKSDIGANNGRFYRWYKKHLVDPGLKDPEISADALYYLGVSKEIEGTNGKFFNLTTLEEPAPPARDRQAAEALWKASIDLVGMR